MSLRPLWIGLSVNCELEASYQKAASLIRHGRRITAFTGAGISVESGIPPFRGPGGLWSKYDPRLLDIDYFREHPGPSWAVIKEIFYSSFAGAAPNEAHLALAAMEAAGRLHCIITQNIDNLHHKAGSRMVWEFHGNSRNLVCLGCSATYRALTVDLSELPPTCRMCGGTLKPDFVFFGESIPEPVGMKSSLESYLADVFLLIGTTGAVMPASLIPRTAKGNGAHIIEINPEESEYTDQITDVFLKAKATVAMTRLIEILGIDARPGQA
jgi:NAD-dependent deacetylase